jgi:hypothetical protein
VDGREAWVRRHAEELRHVLADPQVRAEVLALLGGDDQEPADSNAWQNWGLNSRTWK